MRAKSSGEHKLVGQRGSKREAGLTTKTDSWSAVEGHETASDVLQLWTLPPLRPEFIRIFAVKLFVAMHVVWRESYAEPFPNKQRRLSIWTSAPWEDSCLRCFADVDGYISVQSVCCGEERQLATRDMRKSQLTLTQDAFEVRHSVYLCSRQRLPNFNCGVDFLA